MLAGYRKVFVYLLFSKVVVVASLVATEVILSGRIHSLPLIGIRKIIWRSGDIRWAPSMRLLATSRHWHHWVGTSGEPRLRTHGLRVHGRHAIRGLLHEVCRSSS